jgi:hypothetical protein
MTINFKNSIIMKKTVALLTLITFTLSVMAAIGGKAIPGKEERNVGSFTKIELRGPVDLYLYQGNTQRVVIEADDDILSKVETYVEGEILVIDTKNNLRNVKVLKAYITFTGLEGVTVSGSGDVYAEETIEADDFMLLINGSGDVEMDLEADKIKCKINGSGDVVMGGETERLYVGVNGSGDMKLDFPGVDECELKLTGSGDIKITGSTNEFYIKQVSSGDVSAFGFKAETCTVDKSGSGDTKVYVNGELAITSSGSGDVYYKGNPDITSISVSGSGDVRKAD